ncbi:MAG: trypsin-like peptidase domain-containing protein [Burkholderiaceae bacterium]|jgi:hypothetical protein|nr:trypsin-like peptidase domain-containing protein [Burkholderiaceae bacterium]
MRVSFNISVRGLLHALALTLAAGLAHGQAADPGPAVGVGARVQPADAPREFLAASSLAPVQAVRPLRVELGTWLQVQASSARTDGLRQVGAQRPSRQTASAEALGSQLQWKRSVNGGWLAAVSVRSEGAYGLRLGVEIDQLPGSALLRVYAQGRRGKAYEIAGQRVLQIIQANQEAGDASANGRTWWTPDSGGDEATLEIELPPGTPPDMLRVAIPRVVHVHENLSLPMRGEEQMETQALDCQLDVACYDAYATQSKAVARMYFVSDGSAYVCTGTLMNDLAQSGTPYFLTANHCISSQTVASTLETMWFYRSASCTDRSSAAQTLRGGAVLLYASADQDGALLQLREAPPAGAVFAAWSTAMPDLGADVVGMHHPKGGLQKLAFGRLQSARDCTPGAAGGFACSTPGQGGGNFYRIEWSQGRTEGGSSGSGLFVDGKLVGTLYGGANGQDSGTSCSPYNVSYYGRLDKLYPAIRQWLEGSRAPASTTQPPGASVPATPGSTSVRVPVYRFFNTRTGAHFYTANVAERDYVIANYREFQYENVAFYAATQQLQGLSPVFRFYNTSTGAHFYTIDAFERQQVNIYYKSFKDEGSVWYALAQAGTDSVPMYRFFNLQTGAHFYTINAAERDFVVANYPAFKYEGVAYQVWSSQ